MKMNTATMDLSILARFNELKKYQDYLINDNCLEEFLIFAKNQEQNRLKWLECENEKNKLALALETSKKEISTLEHKLSIARRLIDQEKAQAKSVDEDRKALEHQLQTVRDILLTDERNKLHDETKEKLKFLNSTMNSRRSIDVFGRSNDHLSIIQELESTGSVLSDLSYSRSEDGLDVSTMFTRNERCYGKHRPTVPLQSETINVKRRKSSMKNSDVIRVQTKQADQVVATTTVKLDLDGSISAQSQIETIPTVRTQLAPSESLESGLSIDNNKENAAVKTPSTLRTYNNPLSSSSLNVRHHHLITKVMLRGDTCDVCGKRTKFGSTAMRCQDCKSVCHIDCKNNLPLPCIQPGNTPTTKGVMGYIADYTPIIPPMIPSLVVHCINEVEARGLDEVGIYRVPGSDKEVRALKEKFLRGKGLPNLSTITDIHVVCGCLKEFLRSLREPLVTHKLWYKFVTAADTKDEVMRKANLIQIITADLPQANRETLAFVVLHLKRVSDFKDVNKMTLSNLACVFAPTIVGYSQSECEYIEVYSETRKATVVMEQLLNLPCEFFHNIISSASEDAHLTPSGQHIVGNTLSQGFLSTPHGVRSLRSKKNFFTPSH
uniref:Rho-GAP domain-containing protein n=1 Tax=Clastoptera arizonana TaxID=38151 RepID=A0A1B6DTY9_9HEMI